MYFKYLTVKEFSDKFGCSISYIRKQIKDNINKFGMTNDYKKEHGKWYIKSMGVK